VGLLPDCLHKASGNAGTYGLSLHFFPWTMLIYIYIRIYIYIPIYYLDPNMYFAFVGRNPQCGLPRFLIFGWPFWCLSLYVSNTETKANHSMYMYISSYKMSCCIYMYIYIYHTQL
jgi:hypothetical protein